MSQQQDDLFVFTAQAIAGDGLSYRPGARHALLTFIAAPDLERAAEIATQRVTAEGWLHIDLLRSKAISGDTSLIADKNLRKAADHALADGCSFVVYGDPMPPDA